MTRRILHVINNLGHGGAEHQLLLNLAAMDRDRFDSYLCCVRAGGELEAQAADLGVPVHVLDSTSKLRWPVGVVRLRRLIRRLRIDVVHTCLAEADIIGGLAGRLAGIPVVNSLVNAPYGPEWLVDNPHLNGMKLRIMKTMLSFVYKTCHRHHIAISRFVKESAIQALGLRRGRISVIYRALPPQWFDGHGAASPGALADDVGGRESYPLLLNVGRLMPQKGHRYLLEAMPQVLRRFPKARLLIVGKGLLHERLVALRDKLGLGDHIIFLGIRNDVRHLLQLCDIFVFPSLFEGLGVSLIEAAGAGKPCVASRVGPIPEVIDDGESGLLVTPQSPHALADAILELASDPHRMRSMGRRARQIAQKKFSIARTIKQLEAVYEGVLSKLGGREARWQSSASSHSGVRHL